jgi:hypothetical protein
MQLSANQKSKKIQSYKLREAHVMSKQSLPLSESVDSSSRPGAPAMPFQSLFILVLVGVEYRLRSSIAS